MRESAAGLAAKRACVWLGALVLLGVVGGYAALTATNPKIPHPWGEVRLTHFSTNDAGTLAHFRFRNFFEWPVLIEVAVEVHGDHTWELARGYSMFVPIEKAVGSRDGRTFSVPVPFDHKEWRVVVRAIKEQLTSTEICREEIKQWLQSHSAGVLAYRIQIHDPNGYVMAGPDMRFDKPGQLPTPHYGSAVRLPAWEPFPTRASPSRASRTP